MGQPKFEPHPESAPGDFYVENGCCAACGAPHVVAPDLVGWSPTHQYHCVWVKQPETEAELERALKVFEVSDLKCHRYCGTDPAIIARIGRDECDYPDGDGS